MNNPKLLSDAFSFSPDYVVIILAGNGFNRHNVNSDVYDQCRLFYHLIRENLPSSVIISAQAELRFSNPHHHHTACEDYVKRRNAFNRFLKRFALKDFILQISGLGRLDDEKYYRDNIHLNRTGLAKYFEYIVKTLNYCLKSSDK